MRFENVNCGRSYTTTNVGHGSTHSRVKRAMVSVDQDTFLLFPKMTPFNEKKSQRGLIYLLMGGMMMPVSWWLGLTKIKGTQ